MNTKTLSLIAGSALLVGQLIGCHSGGMSRYEQPGHDQSAYLASMVASPAGEAAMEPASFESNARIAVAQIGEVAPPAKFLDKLRKSKLFSSVDVLPAGPLIYASNEGQAVFGQGPQQHLSTLRKLAQSTGADYLLLIGGSVQSDTRATALSVLNVTVVGMYLVPSDLTSGELKASAAMIEARSGRIAYLSSAQKNGSVLTTYAGNDAAPARLARKLANEASGKLADAVIADGTRQASLSASNAHHELAAGNRNPRLAAIAPMIAR